MVVGDDWEKHNISNLVRKNPDALKQLHLYLSCEKGDEFGLEVTTRKIHDTLESLGIKHTYEINSDPKNSLSPHALGSIANIVPAIKRCLAHMKSSETPVNG